MGVFAYSVHINHCALASVIDAVRDVMKEHGFRENLGTPQDSWEGVDVNSLYEQAIHGSKKGHAFYVTEPRNGWVGLLCRSQWDMPPVLSAFSAALGTSVLSCDVHDSDFWGYQLYVEGACRDVFNSETASLTLEDVLRMLAIGEIEEAVGHFPELSVPAEKLARLLHERRPSELRKFDQYMERVYGAICDNLLSHEDLDRYANWGVMEAKAIMAGFPEEFPESLWKLNKTSDERYASLRHVLRPEVTVAEFAACLAAMDLAERCLESFLGLFDISSHFAHLNYEEVGRRGEETLGKYGVKIVQHLEFKLSTKS